MIEELLRLINMIFKGEVTPIVKTVKNQTMSGVIYIPKRYVNKRVIVILENDI